MKNLIPHFIQDRYLEGKSRGQIDAFIMFVDLSGFTPLTEGLMREGARGAERLSIILNEIFSPLVSLVYTRGGFIPYYAGDAFVAIFPSEESGKDPLEFIRTSKLVHDLFERRDNKFGKFTIGMRMGLSHGPVDWGIVGKEQKSFYFRGAPIDQSANSNIIAKIKKLELVISRELHDLLEGYSFEMREVDPGFYEVLEEMDVSDISLQPGKIPHISEDVASIFLPNSVAKYDQEGEFRSVITIFISFKGVKSHELLDRFAGIILEQINNFSGYFKEIDFSDKGGVMACFFGAPVSFENNLERSLEFISSVREELSVLQEQTELQFRIGCTFGTAYTGIVGGEERCQYAAVGNRVNMAARLMTYADWGETLVDDETQKNRAFKFLHKGDIKYKGFKGSVPTFKLIGRDYSNSTVFSGQLVGRDAELRELLSFSQPLFKHQKAGIAYVYGEAGIGKSRLLYEFRQALAHREPVSWLTCQSDQILKKPFNPFIYLLRNYFEQSPDSTSDKNTDNFESIFKELQDNLLRSRHPEFEVVKRELDRTKSVLEALIGIYETDSLWGQLDAKGLYQNTIAAIVNLIIAESMVQPIVVQMEDSQWLDDNSKELLNELTRRIESFPIMLVIISRYKDDGTKPQAISKTEIDLPELEINLKNLTVEAVRSFAENTLNGPVGEEFFDLLVRTTNANPFYLEQVLEYFAESNLLKIDNGKWTIKDQNVRLSSSINAILTARIDRLSTLVKETVKAAAVIGREFEVPVLSEVMKAQKEFLTENNNPQALLKEQIKKAEKGQIWLAMNELRYIFRHSLLRETVYSMQLRARLKQLHQLIAEAIERLYLDNLEERYFDLAFHYEQAGVFDKTCEYLRKAADYAKNNYQNQQALDYYEKLLANLGRQDDVLSQIKTHLKKGKVLELIGEWDECENAYSSALNLAKKSRDVLLLGQANNSIGRLLLLKGDYFKAMGFLQTSAGLFESIDDKNGIANVYGNLGNLYFRQGQYHQAKSYFEQSIAISNQELGVSGNAQIVANLGLTHMNQGHFEEGIQCQKDQLEICEANNDKQGMATLYTNLGIVFFEKGDYEEALASYQKGLELSEELGNKLLTSIATGCIGSVYERKGDYDRAMENFERDLELCEELGDKQGIAIALGLIGELHSIMGNFHQSIEYLQKNLMLCEELGYQKGIGKAVNTLGDVFYAMEDYDRSLHFYNRAIEVARRINNKLVLGFSLVEKGAVLISENKRSELDPVFREALEIAEDLGNPDLLFEAKILAAKTHTLAEEYKQALSILHGLLIQELTKDQQAAVYYELHLCQPELPKYKERALALYQELYSNTPKHLYKTRLEFLNSLH